MAADNRLSPAILDQKWLMTTSYIFTIKWFITMFYLIDFILICYKNSNSKSKWLVLLMFLHFWGPVLRIYGDCYFYPPTKRFRGDRDEPGVGLSV